MSSPLALEYPLNSKPARYSTACIQLITNQIIPEICIYYYMGFCQILLRTKTYFGNALKIVSEFIWVYLENITTSAFDFSFGIS